jgi:GNAT superfamily N-acetyltransferase
LPVSHFHLKTPVPISEFTGKSGPEMIGLARIVTDYVTFGYLTDVYVVKEHQGKGHAKWMMQCLGEILDDWPQLRHFFLFTHSPRTGRLYENTIGAVDWRRTPTSRLIFMERRGPGAKDEPEEFHAELQAHLAKDGSNA